MASNKVAVVDFDVHHGNGTQEIFWSKRDLFYGSTHQMPLFPGTGALRETGVGNIWNAPLKAGDGTARFREALETRIFPALIAHRPELIVISAGFDAHRNDPLGGLELTEADFAWVTLKLMDIADRVAGGRVVSMLEGGYDLTGLSRSVAAHVQALLRGTGEGSVAAEVVTMVNETPVDDLDFETALRELEEIVNRLEWDGSTSRPRSPYMSAARR